MSMNCLKSLTLVATFVCTVMGPAALAGDPAASAYRVDQGPLCHMFGTAAAPVGDVNQDGVCDYVVGEFGAGNWEGAATLISGAEGAFLHEWTGASWLAFFGMSVGGAGDVDGDGTPDIIVGAPLEFDGNPLAGAPCYGAAYVYSGKTYQQIFRIQGGLDSTFGMSVTGVGDVNGDGHADFAVGAPSASNIGFVYVFSGANASLLTVVGGQNFPGRIGHSIAAMGESNGKLNLLIGGFSANKTYLVDVRHQTLLRTFSTTAGGEFGWAVANAGDTDGDGTNDVLIGARSFRSQGNQKGRAYLYSGASGGLLRTFEGIEGGATGYSLAGAGDFDHDGHADVVIGSPGSNLDTPGRFDVYSGYDGHRIRAVVGGFDTGDFGFAVAGVGDINGDGLDDVLVTRPQFGNFDGGAAYIYVGTDDPYAPPVYRLSPPTEYAMTGSDRLQVIAPCMDTGPAPDLVALTRTTFSIRKNGGDGTFENAVSYNIAAAPNSITACDVNRDHRSDLLITTSLNKSLNFYKNTGSSVSFDSRKIFPWTPTSVIMCDFDNDSREDAIVSFSGTDKICILRNSSGPSNATLASKMVGFQTVAVGSGPVQVVPTSINGDLRMDLLVLNRDAKSIAVLLQQSNHRFLKSANVPLGVVPLQMAVADLNMDGRSDVVVLPVSSNRVLVRFGNASGTFGAAVSVTTGADTRAIAMGDLNQDGYPDLVAAVAGNNTIATFLNNRHGGFTPSEVQPAWRQPNSIVITDVDGDSDLDIITVNRGSGTLTTFMNTLMN